MDFEIYSQKLNQVRLGFEEATNTMLKKQLVVQKYRTLLGFVHGVWKQLSQAAEMGQPSFVQILNTTSLVDFDAEQFVNELKEFSFDVSYAVPDEKGNAFGQKMIGKDLSNVYVFKFMLKIPTLSETLLEGENRSWANML